MQTDFINQIQPTPKLSTSRCKLIAVILRIFLQFTSYGVGLLTWYLYDYFIAIALFLLSFIVMGIVRSKIIHSVIPSTQQEYNYTTQSIADWYIARELCIELKEDK